MPRTFLQIQEDVFIQLKEELGDTGYWTRQEVKNAINDTYMSIADKTNCFRLIAIIEIRIGIRIYKLPSNYIIGSLNRVEFDSKIIFPRMSSELDEYNRSWRTTEASEITHYLPPGDICKTDEIGVYPLPDTDGAAYNLASQPPGDGVVTTIVEDDYLEFSQDEGTIVDTDGEARFIETEGTGPVMEIKDPTDNLTIYAAQYPKRLFNNKEVFLHPITENPRKIITLGTLAILFAKEGDGKDIAKASFYNKRFEEVCGSLITRPKVIRKHKIRSISDSYRLNKGLNLGASYPVYPLRRY